MQHNYKAKYTSDEENRFNHIDKYIQILLGVQRFQFSGSITDF